MASSKVEKLNRLTGKTKANLEKLRNQAGRTAARFQEKFPSASRAVAVVGQVATKVKGKVQALGQVVASKVTAAFGGLKKVMLAVGAAAALGMGVAVKESMGFNAQMSRVQAISSATGEDFALLRNKALEMGKSTRFSAKEAGEGLEELARAGFGAKDAAGSLPGVLNLAAASGVTLAQSADMASSVLKGFQLEATESDRVADILAKTTNTSATNMEGLSESFKYFMSTAQPMGITLEETAAAIGILGDGKLQGSIATNTLASGLSRLAKPTRQMRILMKGLGIQTFDAQGKFIGLAGLTQELERVTSNMTDKQKQATLATIFGANAIKNFSTLLNSQKKIQIDAGNATQIALMKRLLGEKRVNEALAKGGEITLKGAEALKAYNVVLATAEGTAKKMAETMDNNLAGDVIKAKSAFSGLMISIGDKFDPMLRRMTQSATGILSDLGNNFESYLGILSGAFAPLRSAFGEFRQELAESLGLTSEFGGVSLGVTDVVNGIAQAIGFVTPFIAGFLQNVSGLINTISTTFAPMKEKMGELFGGIQENLLMVMGDVWTIAGELIRALSPIIEVVIDVANVVMKNFGVLWKSVSSIVNMVLPFIYDLADSFRANVDLGGFFGRVMRGVTHVVNGLRPVLMVVLKILRPIGKLFMWIAGILTKVAGKAFEKLGSVIGTVFNGIGKALGWLIEKLEWVFSKIERGLQYLGILKKEEEKADASKKGTPNAFDQSISLVPDPKQPPGEGKKGIVDQAKIDALGKELDAFRNNQKRKALGAMSNQAFEKLIIPTHKKRKKSASEEDTETSLSNGTSRITGGGSKQVHINISIGAINGVGNIENVNNIESNAEVNQSADFIVQEIVRKLNGALMVQEGV